MLEPLLDADEAVARGSLLAESRRYERGDYERGLAEADAVVEAEYTTQTLNHNPLETHQCVCEWRGDTLDVYVSTSTSGASTRPGRARACRRTRCAWICEFMGGGFGAKNGSATTSCSRPSWRGEPAGRCAARSPAGRRTSSAATGTRPASA